MTTPHTYTYGYEVIPHDALINLSVGEVVKILGEHFQKKYTDAEVAAAFAAIKEWQEATDDLNGDWTPDVLKRVNDAEKALVAVVCK